MSGDMHASIKMAALEDSGFIREAAIDRLRTRQRIWQRTSWRPDEQTGGGCTPEGEERAAWGQVFGSWDHIDGNAVRLKRDIGGFVGAGTGVRAGLARGRPGRLQPRQRRHRCAQRQRQDRHYHLGLYGASHSWNKTDISRSVVFAGFADSVSAKYDSTATQLFGELGHRIDAGAVALEPFAGLAHVRVKSDTFFERGGPAALYGDAELGVLSRAGTALLVSSELASTCRCAATEPSLCSAP